MSDPTAATPAEQSPHEVVSDMFHAALLTQALAVVAELGIADLVADGPLPVTELAERTGSNADALYRTLRALAGSGVFSEVAPRTFGTTPLADTLREGEGTFRGWARLWGIPSRHAAIGALGHSVRTGEPSFHHLYGHSLWAELDANPAQQAVFDGAMGDLARRSHAATLEAYDFSGIGTLVDVGGGRGHLVSAILRRHPGIAAVVFDRPEVIAHAPAVLAAAGVADRSDVIAGDFFAEVPAGADAYTLSMILHDWDDAAAEKILRTIRTAMGGHGELLVVDAVVPEGDSRHDGKLRDLLMLTLHPGRERTEAEFAALFERSGLRLVETRAVSASTGLLVAVPGPKEA